MKKIVLVVGAVLAVALLAFAAVADNNVSNNGTYYSNARTGSKTDASGNAYVTESNPAMDANGTYLNIIQATNLAVLTADSSGVIDTHRFRTGTLLLKIVPRTGTSLVARVAVQIRLHLNGASDSASVFAFYPLGVTPVTSAGAVPDTMNTGHITSGSTSTVWSSEFVVTANGARNTPVSAGAADFGIPNGIAIPLQSIFGRDLYAPYMSVRVRVLVGPSCDITAHYVGTPL